MLITKNDIELRNLQEQVQKNKEDIAKHYEIDRFRFILDNPSKSIIEMWEKLMENGVLDTYDREHNRAFMRLDLSKLNNMEYKIPLALLYQLL